jgi:hypothetical protein
VVEPAPPPPENASAAWPSLAPRLKAAKLRLLRVRYVLGYLAVSLLVSVPLDLGYRVAYGQATVESLGAIGVSILYGLICLSGFLALRPLTGIPWERVRIPEYTVFEMRTAAWSAGVAVLLLAASLLASFARPALGLYLPPRLFWTVLVLMVLAWAKIKLQTLVFPEFYADRGGEKIL